MVGQTLALSGGVSIGTGITDATPTLSLIGAGDGFQTGNISGAGLEVIKSGTGMWTLSGLGTYTGVTTVNGGKLLINGDFTGANGMVTVNTDAILGGLGTLGGNLTVAAGGKLAPGNSPGTLFSVGSALFSATASLEWELNGGDTTVGSGINDLFTGVTNLTLDGTLNVTETVPGSFLSGPHGSSWRIINYSGTLTDNTLELGTIPALQSGWSLQVDTTTAGQVNLILVPEPSVVGLLAMLFGSSAMRRSRRSR